MSHLTSLPAVPAGTVSFIPHNTALENIGFLVAYLLQQCQTHPDGLNREGLEGFAIVLGEMTENIVTLSDESDRLEKTLLHVSSSLASAN